MSHPTTVRHALWDALRGFYRNFRRAVATASEHDGRALMVAEPIEEVEAALGRQHFGPNCEFSYNKRGEDPTSRGSSSGDVGVDVVAFVAVADDTNLWLVLEGSTNRSRSGFRNSLSSFPTGSLRF